MATTNYHEILVGSTTTKLRLATDQNGKPLYTVHEEVPQHQGRLEIGQEEWSGGHGQYKFRKANKYFDGQSIDTTQEGRVLLGPKIYEVYSSASGTKDYYNTGDDFQSDNAGVYWTAQSFTTGSAYTISSVRLKLWRIGFPGDITVGIYATTGGDPTGSALCTGTSDGNTLTDQITSEWRTINFTTPVALSNATKYAIVLNASGSGGGQVEWRNDSSAPSLANGEMLLSTNSGTAWTDYAAYDMMFETYGTSSTALSSTPKKFLWSTVAGKLLMADSAKIYYYDGTNFRAATTTVANVSDMVEYNSVIYAACGSANLYYYSTNGDNWTITDLTDGYAEKFLVAPNPSGTADILWKAKTPNLLSSTTDGRTVGAGGVQWTSVAYIGDTTSDITTPFLCGNKLKVGRTDNLYEYSSNGGVHPQMDELKNSRSTQNFKYVANWQGSAYFSRGTGVAELTNYDYFSLMGPLAHTTDIDKVGFCIGLAADTDYLYAAMLENTVAHIYKGKPDVTDSTTEWNWCPWVYVGSNLCETIAVVQHSITDRRLWFGYGTHTAYVQITDNPTTDAGARFASSGFVRMSYIYGTNPYYDKMYQSILTETVNCAANITVQPKYRKDSETSMTNLTAAITTNGVVSTALTTAVPSKRIQFELDLATNNATITPQVLSFIAKGNEKPEVFRVHEATYIVGSRLSSRAKTIRANLRSAQTSTSLIKFSDLRYTDKGVTGTNGTDYTYVVMEPGYPQETEILVEPDHDPELGLTVRWREVNV